MINLCLRRSAQLPRQFRDHARQPEHSMVGPPPERSKWPEGARMMVCPGASKLYLRLALLCNAHVGMAGDVAAAALVISSALGLSPARPAELLTPHFGSDNMTL